MCGVLGIRAPGRDVARLAYFGLFALQHRGQESAGIAVADRGRLTVLRDMGLVTQVFSEEKLRGLGGDVAIGHCRYSTTGSTHWANAQPIVQHGRARTVTLGHNGNLTNAEELRSALAADGVRLSTTSDTEVIAALIANDPAPLEEAVAGAMRRLEGAFTTVALAESTLIGFRDPHGFRPLSLGRIDGDAVLASETCALDLVGAEFGHPGRDRLRACERHPVLRGPDQEPLRRPHLHRARSGPARARDPSQVQPTRGGRRQTRRARRRLDRPRQHDAKDRRRPLRGGRAAGARADLLAPDRLALLLRDRLRGRGATRRVVEDGRAGPRADRRDEPRLLFSGSGPGRDDQAREGVLPRLLHPHLPHSGAGRQDARQVPLRAQSRLAEGFGG